MLWNTSVRKSSVLPIYLDGRTCLLWAVLLLTLPLTWLLSAMLAALFHELCHLLALALMGIPVHGIGIGSRGSRIHTPPLDPKRELVCAAAGPLGSLFLLLFLRQIPRIAICAAFQGLYNLLPLYPLDGGRILRSGRELLSQEKYLAKNRNSLYNSATKGK